MKKIFTSLLIATMLLWSGVGSVFASTYDTTKLDQAYSKIVSYYQSHQTLSSPDEIIAVEALGLEVEKGFDFPDLKSQDFTSISLGDLTKTIIALTLIGEDPTHISGQNLVTLLEGYIKEDGSIQDSYGSTTDIWVLFALESVSSSKTQLVANHLANNANDDGGYWYKFNGTKTSSPDTTGWAIEALSNANKQTYATSIQKALEYLKGEKKKDASYGMAPSADTQSCVLQGMFAYDKASTLLNDGDAIDVLLSFQLDDGSFKSEIYDKDYNPTGTYEFNAYTTMEAARCLGTYKNGSVITKAQKAYQDMKTPVKEETKTEEPQQSQEKPKKKIVETGDESNVIMIVSVMMVIGGIVVLLRKNNENI